MPVFNEEEYLREALDSWTKQTLIEKELICIDDGSTDDSVNIINIYKKNFSGIKLLQQKRQGAGAARNLGLKYAQGEFVCFLDADDSYMDSEALEHLYNAAVIENADIVAGLLQCITPDGVYKDNVIRMLLKNEKLTRVKYEDFQFDCQYQCYIFKKSLLDNECIRFPLYKRFQDPPFLVQALYSAKEFVVCPVEFYLYRYGFKIINYDYEKTNDLFEGLMFDLTFALEHDLKRLLELTLSRINDDYFEVLYEGLSWDNKRLLIKMLEADKIVGKHNIIQPLDCLLYKKNKSDIYEYKDFLIKKKIRKLIPENSKIILYGAGKFGQQCFRCMKDLDYEIVAWIDTYKAGNQCQGENIVDESYISKVDYDIIFISIKDKDVSLYIKEYLKQHNVDKEKIFLWETSYE